MSRILRAGCLTLLLGLATRSVLAQQPATAEAIVREFFEQTRVVATDQGAGPVYWLANGDDKRWVRSLRNLQARVQLATGVSALGSTTFVSSTREWTVEFHILVSATTAGQTGPGTGVVVGGGDTTRRYVVALAIAGDGGDATERFATGGRGGDADVTVGDPQQIGIASAGNAGKSGPDTPGSLGGFAVATSHRSGPNELFAAGGTGGTAGDQTYSLMTWHPGGQGGRVDVQVSTTGPSHARAVGGTGGVGALGRKAELYIFRRNIIDQQPIYHVDLAGAGGPGGLGGEVDAKISADAGPRSRVILVEAEGGIGGRGGAAGAYALPVPWPDGTSSLKRAGGEGGEGGPAGILSASARDPTMIGFKMVAPGQGGDGGPGCPGGEGGTGGTGGVASLNSEVVHDRTKFNGKSGSVGEDLCKKD